METVFEKKIAIYIIDDNDNISNLTNINNTVYKYKINPYDKDYDYYSDPYFIYYLTPDVVGEIFKEIPTINTIEIRPWNYTVDKNNDEPLIYRATTKNLAKTPCTMCGYTYKKYEKDRFFNEEYVIEFDKQNTFANDIIRFTPFLSYYTRDINTEEIIAHNVVSVEELYKNCEWLTTLDASHYDVYDVKNFTGMFQGCKNLKEILFNNWYTNKAIEMVRMFYECENIEKIDIRWFRARNNMMRNVKYSTEQMFAHCKNLKHLTINEEFKYIAKVYYTNNCFEDCPNIFTDDDEAFNIFIYEMGDFVVCDDPNEDPEAIREDQFTYTYDSDDFD